MIRIANILIVASVFVLVFAGSGFAGVVEEIPSGGDSGGGGGGGSTNPPYVSPEIREWIDLPGFHVSLYANNREAEEHTWEWEGKKYTEVWPKETYGSVDFNIEQGALGNNYLPMWHEVDIRRYDDQGNFIIGMEFAFLLVGDASGWKELPQGSTNWDFGGFHISTNSSVQHHSNLEWNKEKEDWVEIWTEDIDGYASFSFEDAETTYASLDVHDWGYWWNGDYYDGLRIEGFFDVFWKGSEEKLEVLNLMIPSVGVPEPVTIALISFGVVGCWLTRREKS